MIVPRNALLVLFAAFVAQQSYAFTTASLTKRTIRTGAKGAFWKAVKLPIENDQKEAALDALNRLLERQKAEIEETERLLRRFRSTSDNLDESDDDINRSLSLASSIMSGIDYGFVSRSEGATFSELKGGFAAEYGPPGNLLALGSQQFFRNLNAMKGEYRDEVDVELTPDQVRLRSKLQQLTLNSTAIWEKEEADGPIQAPWLIKVPYLVLCWFLDTVFEGQYVPSRFFFLETVARMPYFSYITMLHLYETLGFWRRSADIKRIHFAEEINEFRHLLIMESLGGDQQWWVRFLAQHSAIAYFLVLCFLWAFSPSLSYKFSELLETHAVNTYGQMLEENEDLLKELPPSLAAVEYYSFGASDPFYAEFQTSALKEGAEPRRPGENMRTLFDVFCAIRSDEGDHVSTMKACLDPSVAVKSPSLEKRVVTGIAVAAAISYFLSTGDIADFTDLSGALDGVSDAVDATGVLNENSGSLLDSVLAGAAGFASQVANDEEEGNIAGLGNDLIESGAVGAGLGVARKFAVQILETIAEILAAII